jgi:hypothetical protein
MYFGKRSDCNLGKNCRARALFVHGEFNLEVQRGGANR